MNFINRAMVLAFASVLVACGGGANSSDQASQSRCEAESGDVNWQLLLNEQAQNLSEYNLFQKDCDPTSLPNSGGFPYELTTALFTDYSSKYRYTFIPPNASAQYSEDEVLEYPVGTVLVKSFAVPKDTSLRGYQSDTDFTGEKMIETRLLIRREAGWIALPYIWNEEQTDATLHVSGKSIDMSIVHNGEQKDFNYIVPDIQTCKQCHQLTNTEGEQDVSRFTPIGPKARFLNRDMEFESGVQNQLAYMIDHDLLTGAPADLTSIDTAPAFEETTDISGKDAAELEKLAKGYLDINCAHCHRRTGDNTDDGKAGYSGLKLEYWRSFVGGENEHGVCKIPIAYSVQGLAFDVVPGNADESILP